MTTIAPAPRHTTATRNFGVNLTLLDGYAFRIDFDSPSIDPLITDEPPPLGRDDGPSPSRLLVAAIANCLAASLLHCMRKARVPVGGLQATATGMMSRNDYGRWRIERVSVILDPRVPVELRNPMEACIERFEDFCIVTESVRNGIDVDVTVVAPSDERFP